MRLYPGLPTLEEWHTLELAASQLMYAVDARLVPIKEIALDVWPRLSFDCADAESLARRIAREPMAPAEAVAMCADVTAALAALGRAGVPPVDISPADIVLVGRAGTAARRRRAAGRQGRTRVRRPRPRRARACGCDRRPSAGRPRRAPGRRLPDRGEHDLRAGVDRLRRDPRAAAGRGRSRGRAGRRGHARCLRALEQVLRRGLAQSPSERYATPAALVEALCDAVGVPLRHSGSERRARPARGARRRRDGGRSRDVAASASRSRPPCWSSPRRRSAPSPGRRPRRPTHRRR